MSINILDSNTINKIAAGEVVERPSSVVKELVENAIDAGANAITVEIKDGGMTLIRVTDNGCGIHKEEVKVAFLRHSTSKIKTAADLLGISSLGFSRQGVHDMIKRCNHTLEDYEARLHLVEKFVNIRRQVQKIQKLASGYGASDISEISSEILEEL